MQFFTLVKKHLEFQSFFDLERDMTYQNILPINQLFFQILNKFPPNYHLKLNDILCM